MAGIGAALLGPAAAARPRSLDDPLLLGVDLDLHRSGMARALQRGFGRDAGLALQLEPAPSARVLERLEAGELDAALTNAPDAELRLVGLGLSHDRRRVATGRFVIVGPALDKRAPPRGGMAAGTDAVALLQRLAQVATAGAPAGVPEVTRFVSRQDGSGAHLAEQALWRAAGIAPRSPWYLKADDARPLLEQIREAEACTLVDAALVAAPPPGIEILVDHDPRLRMEIHLMRSFRVNHPAGPLFSRWVTGASGRRAVATVRGYRPPTG